MGTVNHMFQYEVYVLLPGLQLVLLENVRFYPEEEKNESGFAQKVRHGFTSNEWKSHHSSKQASFPSQCIGTGCRGGSQHAQNAFWS